MISNAMNLFTRTTPNLSEKLLPISPSLKIVHSARNETLKRHFQDKLIEPILFNI